MKIYFAGGAGSPEIMKEVGVKNILSSWLEGKEKVFPFFNIFLDSGAFSAYTRHIDIKIDDYINYIKCWARDISVYAALDVIGNAEKSKANALYMIEKGLKPIPAYHYGEPLEYLEYYCKNFDYIALGGVAQLKSESNMILWLDSCWYVIKQYWPKKVHGFAITRGSLMKRYPFYSVDSTSWLMPGIYGSTLRLDIHSKIKSSKVALFYRKNKDNKERMKKNIEVYLKLERDITSLWKTRGIVWD